MIFIYISSNSIQHEFFIYLICRTVIKTPEVLIFLDISKMSFHLNGTCLAFQDSLFSLDISMGSFFQFPHLVHSFNHKHLCISQPILYPIIILLQKSIIFSKKLVDRIQETRKMVMNTSQKNLIPPSLFSGYRLDRRQVNSIRRN